jgi:pyridoxal phosphate enzyme (YggS family)
LDKQNLTIAGNIAKINESILKTCNRVGRKPDEITLMGVSKSVPEEKIKEAFDSGIRYFGESKVQEALEKFAGLKEEISGIKLHLIGSLQRNKVKKTLQLFDCIQSVDRMELIQELIKHSGGENTSGIRKKPIEVFLELHTGEDTKSGFENINALFRGAELVCSNPNLKPAGLMTMAPYTKDAQLIRFSFRQLIKAQAELEKRFPPKENWACLSMGMSNDYEIAIEEGSNLLRIGSAIFNG